MLLCYRISQQENMTTGPPAYRNHICCLVFIIKGMVRIWLYSQGERRWGGPNRRLWCRLGRGHTESRGYPTAGMRKEKRIVSYGLTSEKSKFSPTSNDVHAFRSRVGGNYYFHQHLLRHQHLSLNWKRKRAFLVKKCKKKLWWTWKRRKKALFNQTNTTSTEI